MTRKWMALAGAGAALLLSGCVEDGYYGGPVGPGAIAYDGYYDDYYGPIYDGYWGDGGAFYYRTHDRSHWRRDTGGHFRRDPGAGVGAGHGGRPFHPMHGTVTPPAGGHRGRHH